MAISFGIKNVSGSISSFAKKLTKKYPPTMGRDVRDFGDDSGNTVMKIPTTQYNNLGALGKRKLKQGYNDSGFLNARASKMKGGVL